MVEAAPARWCGTGLGWAALIVAFIWAVAGAVLALAAKKQFDRINGLEQTTDTLATVPNALTGKMRGTDNHQQRSRRDSGRDRTDPRPAQRRCRSARSVGGVEEPGQTAGRPAKEAADSLKDSITESVMGRAEDAQGAGEPDGPRTFVHCRVCSRLLHRL